MNREQVIHLSSDEESVEKNEITCQRDKCGNLHHKVRHSKTVQDEAGPRGWGSNIKCKY